MPDRPDIELRDKTLATAAERGVKYGEAKCIVLAEDADLKNRYDLFSAGKWKGTSAPRPKAPAPPTSGVYIEAGGDAYLTDRQGKKRQFLTSATPDEAAAALSLAEAACEVLRERVHRRADIVLAERIDSAMKEHGLGWSDAQRIVLSEDPDLLERYHAEQWA
jgi:hypothetical protein